MEPTLNVGDIIFSRAAKCPPQIGDIILYQISDIIIIHRVVDLKNENGVKKYITKGDNASGNDSPISLNLITGKMFLRIPWIGFLLL